MTPAPSAARSPEISTLDQVAEQLRIWRAAAGSPSFTELSRRIAELREERGVHPRHRSPGRMTVYDAFSDGRKRLDIELVVDIAESLGVSGDDLAAWHSRCAAAQGGRTLSQTVTARLGLPPRSEVFVGRAREREACLASTSSVAVIEGMAGTGKTALAVHVARELLARRDVDDVIVVELGDNRSPDDAASSRAIHEAVLRALDEPAPASASSSALAERVTSALADRRLALLLDDVTDVEQITGIADARPLTPVIVTTRSRLDVPEIRRIALSTWDAEDTLTLLRTVAGTERVDEDPAAASALAKLVDGLPLAAALTSARVRQLRGWTLADHASALEQKLASHQLDEPVSASLSLTYSALSPAARRGLRMLASQPCQSIAQTTVAPLLDGDAAAADAVVAELDRAHAIVRVHDGRLALHSLVRAFGVSRSWDEDAPREREAAAARITAVLLGRAWECSERLYPGTLQAHEREGDVAVADIAVEPEEAARWLAEELDSIVELAIGRSETSPTTTMEVARALSRHFDNHGRWPLALSLHRAAADAARRCGDTAGEAYAELGIGTTSVRLGLPDAAVHLERARGLAALSGLRRPGYSATNALAILAAHAGDPQTALERFRECLALAQEDGADALAHLVIDNIAVVLRRLGDLDGALENHRQSLAHATAHDNRNGIATSLGNMSEVYLILGRVDEAIDAAERGRDVARSIASTMTYGYTTSNLGIALHAAGQHERGRELVREAWELSREHSLRALELSSLNNMGHLLVDDDPEGAEEWFREALALGTALDMTDERSRTLHGLGRVELSRGRADLAQPHLEEALGLLGSDVVPEAAEIRALLDGIRITSRPPTSGRESTRG